MPNYCKRCYSFAINHHLYGRDGSDEDLCDVCYWRKRADNLQGICNMAYRIILRVYPKLDEQTVEEANRIIDAMGEVQHGE